MKSTKPCKATASSGAIKCALDRDHAGHHSSLKPGQKKTTQHVTWTTIADGRVEVTTYRGGKKVGNWFEGEAGDAQVAAEVAAEREADVQREIANPARAEERLRDGEGVGLAELVDAREAKDRKKAAKAERADSLRLLGSDSAAVESAALVELVSGIPEPAEEQRALIKLGDATKMLAEIRDAPSAKKLMDVAAAAELYAKKAKLGQDAVNYAGGIKLEAERKLGEYLLPLPSEPGKRTDLEPVSKRETGSRLQTYKDIGITPKLAAEAQRLAGIPEETFARVKAGEIKPMVALRDQRRATLGDRIAALPQGKFRVLYADPPWKYGDERNGSATAIGGDASRSDNSAAHNYPTMPTSEICAFTDETGRHVSDLAAGDAVLFMWATFPLLDDALVVMKAWKFDYRQAFVWHKQRSNVANYHDASCELLLIGVRGSCPIEIDDRVPQLQPIPRGRHSAKPEDFRRLIDRLYPSGPRVELFRRGAAPEGWTVWGNEAVA